MTGMEPLILFGIILALALNFVNGLNDASHSIATVVATRALSPVKAVFSPPSATWPARSCSRQQLLQPSVLLLSPKAD